MSRPIVERERRERAIAASPENRRAAIDSWLEVATASEVRRHWREYWGAPPAWSDTGDRAVWQRHCEVVRARRNGGAK